MTGGGTAGEPCAAVAAGLGDRAGGPAAASDVFAGLERLRLSAPHLRWRLAGAGEPLEADELACASLAADPDALAGAVWASAAGRGSRDRRVLASLWWQAYAYRIAGTALACWLLTGAAPPAAAERTAVGIDRARPASVVYLGHPATAPPAGSLELLVAGLFPGHLDGVAAALRARHRLGHRLLWGNVAAACASAAGAVLLPTGPAWRARLDAFLAAAPHDLASFGAWSDGAPATAGPSYRRTTCCLWWKTSAAGGSLCADCPLPRSPTEAPPP